MKMRVINWFIIGMLLAAVLVFAIGFEFDIFRMHLSDKESDQAMEDIANGDHDYYTGVSD